MNTAASEQVKFIPANLKLIKKYMPQFSELIFPDHDFTGVIVLKEDDTFIGLGYLDDGYQNNVYIDPKFRGLGYGTLIMNKLMYDFKGNFEVIDKSDEKEKELFNKVSYEQKKSTADLSYQALAMRDTNVITEDHRNILISKSQNVGEYKDKTHGKNRFERKRYSKLATSVQQYNKIDMNEFFKRDTLIVDIPVRGETDDYVVTIKFEGVVAEMAKNIKSNNGKFEFKTVIQALTKVFNTTDIYTKCTCKDFEMRFKHWNIVHNVSVDDTAHDPGPGRGIANPNDDKGRGCKHILLALSNVAWLMQVASVIKNYIMYAEEHMQKAFIKVIFPRLYGLTAEEAQEKDLIPEDIKLESEKHIIEVINDWAKNRGKFKKGSNVNPVQADKLEKEQKGNKEETK